jgi:aarF domain-containing kinase
VVAHQDGSRLVDTVISMLLLEGIGRHLDLSLDFVKCTVPILRQLGRQMTSEQLLELMKDQPRGKFGTLIKLYMLIEVRGLINTLIVNEDEIVCTMSVWIHLALFYLA